MCVSVLDNLIWKVWEKKKAWTERDGRRCHQDKTPMPGLEPKMSLAHAAYRSSRSILNPDTLETSVFTLTFSTS